MTYTAEQFAQLSLMHLEAVKRADAALAATAIYCNEIKALKEKLAQYEQGAEDD